MTEAMACSAQSESDTTHSRTPIASANSAACPCSSSAGAPLGRLTTSMSRMTTPAVKPVPRALAAASLAAKRAASRSASRR